MASSINLMFYSLDSDKVYYPPFKIHTIMGRTSQGSMKRRKSFFFKTGHGAGSAGLTSTMSEALDTPRHTLKRLTHQELDRTFTSSDDVIVSNCCQSSQQSMQSARFHPCACLSWYSFETGERILQGREHPEREKRRQ